MYNLRNSELKVPMEYPPSFPSVPGDAFAFVHKGLVPDWVPSWPDQLPVKWYLAAGSRRELSDVRVSVSFLSHYFISWMRLNELWDYR